MATTTPENMRFLAGVFLIVMLACSGKEKPAETSVENTSPFVEEVVSSATCVYVNEKSQRQTFPFSKADKIELVSYDLRQDSYGNRDLVSDGTFSVDSIRQRVVLDGNQRDSLFSILYNFKAVPAGIESSQADCYNPRHSIVFYQKNKAMAFLEICFECGGTKQTAGVDFGPFCPEKLCMLQRFFKASKADVGIDDKLCD
jgi:hypothetical protein